MGDLPSVKKEHARLANCLSEKLQTSVAKAGQQLTVFSFRIRLKRFTMMAGVAQGLALMRAYFEVDGGLDEGKAVK